MSTQVQHRRGTTAQHASFTGAAGEITVDTTKGVAVVHDGATAGGVPLAKESALTAAVSAIINGNFSINQRAVAGSVVLAAGQYGHDRWKAGAGGCTYTFATSGADTIITISAGSLMQVIEGKYVDSSIYTLSQSGNANGRIAINGASTSGSYAALPLSTASVTGGQNITVEFTTGTVSKVVLNPGSSAFPYPRRMNELQLCQQYGFPLMDSSVSNELLGFGWHTSTTNAVISRAIPEMRAVPTLFLLSGSYANLLSQAGSTTITNVTIVSLGSTPRQLQLNVTGTGLTANVPTYVRNSGSSVVQLFAQAEL